MATNKKSGVTKLANVLDKLSERVMSLADNELDEELKASGKDPKQVVESMRSDISQLIANNRKQRLRSARVALNNERSESRRSWTIPADASSRRTLLDQLMLSGRQMPEPLTAAFRDRSSLSDRDIQGILEDLAELGYLNDVSDSQ
jgi:hypothetical protein